MTRCLVLCGLLLGCSRSPALDAGSGSDSGFAAVQQRGAVAMGVDQYTSAHVFEPLPDGGWIVLQRDSVDPAGTATIRAHMEDIAVRFGRGDFSLPGFVHEQAVPGTAVMTARRSVIRYLADTLSRGGQVRIRSDDPAAIAAIHAFLAFQAQDHRAASHSSHPPP